MGDVAVDFLQQVERHERLLVFGAVELCPDSLKLLPQSDLGSVRRALLPAACLDAFCHLIGFYVDEKSPTRTPGFKVVEGGNRNLTQIRSLHEPCAPLCCHVKPRLINP